MLRMTPELRQATLACLLFICQAGHASAGDSFLQPIACLQVVSDMGPFYRWPTVNPGMVAPVDVVFNYPTYRNPLSCSYTGKSIRIDIPASFGQHAGFHLGTTGEPTKSDERYRLARLELRKPAQAYTGLGQALSHVFEMVLIHKEENGDRWANVILPFQVSTNGADLDIINPIIAGTHLPSRISQTGFVMSSAVSEMKLAPAFENATFSEFWGNAPVAGCKKKNVNVRYFMRTNTLAIGVDTFAQMSNALENSPAQEPVQPPAATWLIGTCHNGTGKCAIKEAEKIKVKLANLKKAQGQALNNQRNRKADLDKKLALLKNHSGPATNKSIQLYRSAVAAYTDLKAAASELVSAESHVAKVQEFVTEKASSNWDARKPKANTSATKKKALFVDLSDASGEQEQQTQSDCSALGQSPVDIDTKKVVDTSALSPALIEPLAFRFMSLSKDVHQARLQLSYRGGHLRVAVPPGSTEWPLGGVLSGGVLRGVSYVDIHVPGQHAVDGHVPAAELQLVHESVGGKPAMAVSVPLEGGDETNEWLKPLLASLPEKDAAKEVLGQPLGLLHKTLSTGKTSDYYRYDGSLTTPPCLLTEWFVLKEPGQVSHLQLSDLAATLGVDVSSEPVAPSFMTSLVMQGSPHLVSQVTTEGLSSNLLLARAASFRGRRRLQV